MKSHPIYAFVLVAFASVCSAQTLSDGASQGNLAPHSSILGETNSPLTSHALLLRLNSSFQAVSQARDQKGFVRDRAALKEHTSNLKAFRKALKRRNLPAADTTNSQLQNISHLLRDTMESFFAFELANDQPNNPNIVVTMDVRESFVALSKYLNQLTVAVEQEEVSHTQLPASSTD
jgi:hypothetical protein